jgi:effector-binding domain-containing protein
MDVKAVKPVSFLFFRTETSVSELSNFLSVGQQLFKEAVHLNLPITGPIHWHYFGFEAVTKPFILEIALPVGEVPDEYDGAFHFKRTDAFRCVSVTHEGAWQDIPQAYGKLMQFITENNLTPVSANREIYINADFKHPEANVTEIQIGIS